MPFDTGRGSSSQSLPHNRQKQGGKSTAVPSVELIETKPVSDPSGSLKGFATVRLSGKLLIRDFRIICQPGQAPWVAPPTKSWEGTDGKRQFMPLLEMPAEWRNAIQAVILEAWETHGRVRQLEIGGTGQ